MKNILISHVGLGDMFICNGLVRHLVTSLGQLSVIALPEYFESVEFMFSDDPRIDVVKLNPMDKKVDDLELKWHHLKDLLDWSQYNTIPIGFLHRSLNVWNYPSIDRGFYSQLDLPFDYKWDKYHAPRYALTGVDIKVDYVFVHEDPLRNLTLNLSFDDVYHVIRPTDFNFSNIFMYEDIIRGASEVHVIDSAFSNFIEHMSDLTIPKYLYDAKHIAGTKGFPVYRNNWNLVTDLDNDPKFRV